MQSDSELIDLIFAGEQQAYAVLVERYERQARAAALRIVHDSHVADDVAQESFVAAFESLASLRNNSRFGGWLLGIVQRQAARAIRQRCRSPALVGDVGSRCDPESNGRASPETLELLELVDHLPEQERVVVALRHFDGHSVREIAEITDRPVGTVTKQLSRAHQRLRVWLGEEKHQ